jgi:hypothetical protein
MVSQDLHKLVEIKKKGMFSQSLYKGCRKMYKDDIINLKFILSLLGIDYSDHESTASEMTITESASHFDKYTRL